MSLIGIFYGSDTGNTKYVANLIHENLGKKYSSIFDIAKSKIDDLIKYKVLLFGIPTWYYGDIQCDWEEFIPNLYKLNLLKKKVGIFGCGDQKDYPDFFCDAMSKIAKIVKNQGAKLIGKWPNIGYNFINSKSLINKDYFIGLVIDEDRQKELTKDRVYKWIIQIKQELKI